MRKIFLSNDELDKLTTYINESIQNLSLQINGKGKQFQYSSHAVNLSMPLYLKNKTVYEKIRETKRRLLPSQKVLYDKQLVFKSSPGVDSNSMQFMKDLRKRRKDGIMRHLMMDEIKYKNDIMWNSMNNVVTGFIEDELNLKDIMIYTLGLSLKKITCKLLRMLSNGGLDQHEVMFIMLFYYFNKGILTCNNIAEQFIDVLIYYESMVVKICGLVCDGGGSNDSFLHKIVEAFDLDRKLLIRNQST